MTKYFVLGRTTRWMVLCGALGSVGSLMVAMELTWAGEQEAIKIDNFTFSPKPLRIKPGDEVTWVNRDDIPHSIVLSDLQVHSHPLDTDGTFTYRFEKPGVYNYLCGLHPFMKGQVVVSP
jgi:plastocyanin